MFDLDASDPVDLQPGDVLETVTVIRRGDVVCLERVGPQRVLFRALTPDEQAAYPGPMYRIDRGDEPGRLVLKRVTEADGLDATPGRTAEVHSPPPQTRACPERSEGRGPGGG